MVCTVKWGNTIQVAALGSAGGADSNACKCFQGRKQSRV